MKFSGLCCAVIICMGSTDSFSGTVVEVKPGKQEDTVTTETEVTGIDYQSSPHGGLARG